MTMREIMATVYRELGHDEQQIKEGAQRADFKLPNSAVDEPLQLRDGATERQLIDALKAAVRRWDNLSDKQAAALAKEMDALRAARIKAN